MKSKFVTACLLRFVGVLLLLFTSQVNAQPPSNPSPSRTEIDETLEKEGCVTNEPSKVKICKRDYLADGKKVEAITIRPLAEGKYPGILMIPGFGGTAKTFITLGTILARQGFACLAVTPPGYGKSEGRSDFMGPNSIKVFAVGFKIFQREAFVDAHKIGVFGYSRGGMGASLLTIQLGKEVKAAVFGAGIYDFRKAYDETTFDGIRENMKTETGMTEEAIKQRSSVLRMERLKTPVLIIHGENDGNAPTNQALLLRDRLAALKKDFEIKILPDHKHGQLKGDFLAPVIDFLSRKLKGVSAEIKSR